MFISREAPPCMADTTGLPCLLLTVTLGGTYPCSASVISADRPGGWCNAETCPSSAGWSFRAILRWKPVFICGMLGGCHTPNPMEHRDAPSPLHHLRGTCTWGPYRRTFYRGWGGGYSQNFPGKTVMCWLQADLLPIIKKHRDSWRGAGRTWVLKGAGRVFWRLCPGNRNLTRNQVRDGKQNSSFH